MNEREAYKLFTEKVRKAQQELDFNLPKKPMIMESTIEKQSCELIKFYVYNNDRQVYTTLCAENIHHAANKAAKLYGKNFGSVTTCGLSTEEERVYKFLSQKQYGELIKILAN